MVDIQTGPTGADAEYPRGLTLLAYAVLFEVLGFVISTTLATFALGLLFTGRPLPCAISAVLMGVLLYGLFDYLLDVPLPLGLFEAFVES